MATQNQHQPFLEDTDQIQEDQQPSASATGPSVDNPMATDPSTNQTESIIDLPHRGAPEEDAATMDLLQQALGRHATNEVNSQGNTESNNNNGNAGSGEDHAYRNTNDRSQMPQGDSNESNGETGQGTNAGAEQQTNETTSGGGGPPNGENDTAPPSDLPSDQIDLCVRDSDHNIVYFRIRRRSLLKKVFAAYVAQKGGTQRSLRFLFDGDRLSGNETPETLQMNTGDIIEVHIEQIGGSTPCTRQ